MIATSLAEALATATKGLGIMASEAFMEPGTYRVDGTEQRTAYSVRRAAHRTHARPEP
jgi:hypothetical protein